MSRAPAILVEPQRREVPSARYLDGRRLWLNTDASQPRRCKPKGGPAGDVGSVSSPRGPETRAMRPAVCRIVYVRPDRCGGTDPRRVRNHTAGSRKLSGRIVRRDVPQIHTARECFLALLFVG